MPSTTEPLLPTAADRAGEPRAPRRPQPQAAVRALTEAAARRAQRSNPEAETSLAAHEIGGRGGLDPTRYGDWEVNGLASDF